jgi:hypothetical protein
MKNKAIAFAIHLIFSFVLITTTAGLLVVYFYPGVFNPLKEVYDLLEVLIPVDIIIGPILTFFIYKKGKKGLKLDVTIIALCQMIALAYGCWAVYTARPGFLIFSYDAFYVAPPSINQKPIINNKNLYVGAFDRPKIIYFALNEPLEKQLQMMTDSMDDGTPLQFNTAYFQPFISVDRKKLLKHSIKIEKLKANIKDDKTRKELERLIQSKKQLAYIAVINDTFAKTIVVDVEKKHLIGVLDILPF